MFPVHRLVDSEFHTYLFKFIKEDQNVNLRKQMSKVLGRCVVAALIKQKPYRKLLTDYVDELRLSNNFRDR
jgi:hypothetical protein